MKALKYSIILISKKTGEAEYCKGRYDTEEEALQYAKDHYCNRCNDFSIEKVITSMVYTSEKFGYVMSKVANLSEIKECDSLVR